MGLRSEKTTWHFFPTSSVGISGNLYYYCQGEKIIYLYIYIYKEDVMMVKVQHEYAKYHKPSGGAIAYCLHI
jgi:hypothetical protein